MSWCVQCRTGLPRGARFCPQCGTRVSGSEFETAAPEIREDLQEVAVLFADIQGFTSMSERMDPEEVAFLINPLLSSLAGTVYKYSGYVDKFIGDAVMALFGAPVSQEDDAERAVRAGLAMLETIEHHNREESIALALRIGINLGEVEAAELDSEMQLEYADLGDTADLAARLQEVARPNTVLVSETIYERVKGNFVTKRVPPFDLEGISGQVLARRIMGPVESTATV